VNALVAKLLYAPKGAFILFVLMLLQIGRATRDRLVTGRQKRVNARRALVIPRSC
jgi:hypothetical protein